MIRLRAETPSTSYLLPSCTPSSRTPPLLPLPLPTSSPLLLLPSTDRRVDRPEVCLPPRKRLYIALGLRYEVGESSSAPTARPTGGFRADYGFVATLDDEIRRALATDDIELGRRTTEFATMVRQDTDEIYGRLDEAQDARAVLSGSRPHPTGTACEDTDTIEDTADIVTELQSQQGHASGPAQPEIPEEAGSSS
ncbi:hypothetical protein Tco_1059569 [Tanacetum coccineum]